jgi:hypothetical protein
MGPTVQVMPGPGKTFAVFAADNEACKTFATNQVKGQADAANQRAVGAAVLGTVIGAGVGAATGNVFGDAGGGAGAGAAAGLAGGVGVGAASSSNDQIGIQQQYDNAFSQCMYANGERVPGYAPAVASAPVSAAPDPLVRATQAELIRLGYLNGGSADGFIGPKTRGAISSFEASNGLAADGAPSSRLLAKLQSTPASAGNAPPAAATASAPANWVAPTGSVSATPASASASSGWVAPTKSP